MTTPRLLAVAYLAQLAGAFRGDMPWLFLPICLAGLLAIGELWLRALVHEGIAPLVRLGTATVCGLVSLPLAAISLHLLRIPIAGRPLAITLAALITLLGLANLCRVGIAARQGGGDPPASANPVARRGGGIPHTCLALAVPAGLALVVSVTAVLAYVTLPHPPPPGYTSVALNGWAAGIARPVTMPARGLDVPIRVSSEGVPAATAALRVRVGRRTVNERDVRVEADTTRSIDVFVPAPPDGCLHRIEISVGAASTIFYGRGPTRC
nr:hypothetical protein [uncultured Actinoplanes sp.]